MPLPTIHFFEPPAPQRTGGLEGAIRALEAFLKAQGIRITSNAGPQLPVELGADPVVHFHGVWQPAFLRASARCRRLGIPYVVSPHGMLEPWAWHHKRWKKWPWYYLLERRHLMGARELLATSALESRNLRGLFPGKSCPSIPLGISEQRRPNYFGARHALGWPHGEKVLLYLSRVHPKKGLHLLLEALAAAGRRAPHSHVRLVVVGGGAASYVDQVRSIARHHAADLPPIDWVGEVWGEARWKYLEGADLLCLPSHSENFGLVVLEALQVGTRVLTSTATPWGELRSWGAGWIVEPETGPIAAALQEFLATPHWSADQRDALAERAEADFSWGRVGPAYVNLYRSVASVTTRAVQS